MAKVITIGELLMRFTPVNKGRLNYFDKFNVYIGGAEANVALLLGNFYHDVSMLTATPLNEIGDSVESHLRSGGVDTNWIFRTGERLGTYYYETGVSVKPAKVIYDRCNSSIHQIPKLYIDWNEVYEDVDLLHISGITPALSKDLKDFTIKALKEAKKHHVQISFDFNYRSKLWSKSEARESFMDILPYVDICFAGYRDFRELLNDDSPAIFNENELKKYYADFSKHYGIKYFASTYRKVINSTKNELQGFLYTNGILHKTDCYSFEVIERIGAGDAFAAGIIHGILSHFTDSETVQFAIGSSMLKHTLYGDHSSFREEEIIEFIKSKSNDVQR